MSKLLFCPCRSLVDTVYSLKDELQELKQVSQHFLYMTYQHRPLSVVTILFCVPSAFSVHYVPRACRSILGLSDDFKMLLIWLNILYLKN